jgi:vacuolar-type H+-ATPase subunit E/Vma4
MEEIAGKELRLVADIKRDAEAEAEQVKKDAAREAAERAAQYERQLEEIRTEAGKTGAAQAEAVKRNLKAALAVELKRIALAARDQVFRRVMEQVEEKLARRMTSPDYRRVLLALIVEAAIGLGAEEVEVNASPRELELLDDKLLREAEAKVKELVLKTVKIGWSAAAPQLLQGIVLNSTDGKTAYNNQIRTRLMRNQGQIRKMIYERLQLM